METKTTNAKMDVISEAYIKYYAELVSYFLKYTKDKMKAEDMTQNLFVKMIDYKGAIISYTEKFFIFTIAKRMIMDDLRHIMYVNKSTKLVADTIKENRFIENSDLECKQISEFEKNKLSQLPPKMARVYAMSRFEDKTIDEMARELCVSRHTIASQLLNSRKIIRMHVKNAMNF